MQGGDDDDNDDDSLSYTSTSEDEYVLAYSVSIDKYSLIRTAARRGCERNALSSEQIVQNAGMSDEDLPVLTASMNGSNSNSAASIMGNGGYPRTEAMSPTGPNGSNDHRASPQDRIGQVHSAVEMLSESFSEMSTGGGGEGMVAEDAINIDGSHANLEMDEVSNFGTPANQTIAGPLASDVVNVDIIHEALNGNIETVEELVRREEINKALFVAIWDGDLEQVENLVQRSHANVNTEDANGNTPMLLASYHEETNIIRFLLSSGADVNHRNTDGEAPVHIAAEDGDQDMVRCLVENGASVNLVGENGYTPLLCASKKGHSVTAQFLLQRGANIKHANRYRMTALHYACKHGHLETVECLLQSEPDVNAQDAHGRTPSHHVTSYIIKNRSFVLAPWGAASMDPRGMKYNNSTIIFQLLMHQGAHLDVPDADGLTVLAILKRCTSHMLEYELNLQPQPLQCWSAQAICRNKLRLTSLPSKLQTFVTMHERRAMAIDEDMEGVSEESPAS